MRERVIVFDLDDTLYKEVDFLRSAYREVAATTGHPEALDFMCACYRAGLNVFVELITRYALDCTVDDLLTVYRAHKPAIALDDDTAATLDTLRARGLTLGLMTDGRSLTQRNKIAALGLADLIADGDILISEEFGHGKPDARCYRYFEQRHRGARFTYVGDNLAKDFVTARRRGWTTVCLLDDGRNIFKQDFSRTSASTRATYPTRAL